MLIPSANWTYHPTDKPHTSPTGKVTCSCGGSLAPGSDIYCVRHAEEAQVPIKCSCGKPATQMGGFCFSCSNYG